ncbi:MAG: hypothetical protein ACOZBZ_04775 [Patescibacteria group bacterium]
MGKKRVAILGEEGKPKKEHKKSLKEEKGTQRVRVPGLKGGERVVAITAEPVTAETQKQAETQKEAKLKEVKPPKIRGKKYLAAKVKIDPSKSYPLSEAIRLLKETSFARFDGAAELHLVTGKTGISGDVSLPYFAGKARRIEIANEETLKKIEVGKIDFDILLATPAFMPKLVQFAKLLGPKGLMPNPKNGTITDKPEEAIKRFQKTSVSFKTEQNAPLVHAVFGKISQPEKELEENLKTYLSAVGTKNIKKAVIKGTMGPAVKVAIDNL